MRRSAAPSVKNQNSIERTKHSAFESKHRAPGSDTATASSNSLQDTKTLKFSVTWSKRTTKKHKTWEGDGTLEVYPTKTAILRDLTGAILSSCKAIKSEELSEGTHLIVGSKEVEIQEKINYIGQQKDVSLEVEQESFKEPERKKKKKMPSYGTPTLNLGAAPQLPAILYSAKSASSDGENFLLPSPSYEQQWKENETKLPLTDVRVSSSLVRYLRPHQKEGVVFLYECLLGIRNPEHLGAILADAMGLGKTLQTLTVCHTLLKQGPYGNKPLFKKILIVVPSSLTETWNKEIQKWLGRERMFAYVVDTKHKLAAYLGQIYMPFVVVSYEMLLKNVDEFFGLQFDLLICDEGHRLKNDATKVAKSLRKLNIPRRIILTGTPIQNDLEEFFTLIDFVNPGILGSYQQYRSEYELPIIQSQMPDASEAAKATGNERANKLKSVTNSFILRRTEEVNNLYLPKRQEYIVFVKPSKLQQLMISKVADCYENRSEKFEDSPLQMISVLKKICSHPWLIQKTTNRNSSLIKYISRFLKPQMSVDDSGKLVVVRNILLKIVPLNEKIVLVSNHTKCLDVLSGLCDQLGYKHLRLDGTIQSSDRDRVVEKFNSDYSSEYSVFLLSSKAGGVGLNLSGASRLILFDNDWNPATDLQALSRIWRDGQKSDVKTYRLITAGTIEEKIFQRQIAKTSLGSCVIGNADHDGGMKFSEDDLKDLFSIQNISTCATHEYLHCSCDGTGNNSTDLSHGDTRKSADPFQVALNKPENGQRMLNFNELLQWEHYTSPVKEIILQEACLTNCAEEVVFIFRNKR